MRSFSVVVITWDFEALSRSNPTTGVRIPQGAFSFLCVRTFSTKKIAATHAPHARHAVAARHERGRHGAEAEISWRGRSREE